MSKGPRGEKRPADAIGLAVMIGKIATGEIEDEREELASAAAQLGSKGGKKRAENMTPERPLADFRREFVRRLAHSGSTFSGVGASGKPARFKKAYRTRTQAKADVFDYIECFYNPTRRHSTLGYLSPIDFERQAGVA